METVTVTIRVPNKEMHIIDNYAQQNGISRAEVFRNLIITTAKDIERKKQKERLIAASKKVSRHTSNEATHLEDTLEDGLKND